MFTDTPERISSLRLLVAICKTEQLSAAAQLVNLSPSGASHILNDMKKRFGDPLFQRTGTGLTPTPRMNQLLPRIEAILQSISHLADADAFDPASVSDTFRICAYDNAFMAFLLSVIPKIRAAAPKLNLEIAFVPESQLLVDKLRTGFAELALHPTPPRRNDIIVQELPPLSYVILVRKEHPLTFLAKKRQLKAEDLLPFVQLAPGNSANAVEVRPWVKLRRLGAPTIIQPYFNASPFLVLQTDYYEWMPHATAKQWLAFGGFELLEPPTDLRIAFSPKLFWNRRSHLNPLNQWIRSMIIASARELPPPKCCEQKKSCRRLILAAGKGEISTIDEVFTSGFV